MKILFETNKNQPNTDYQKPLLNQIPCFIPTRRFVLFICGLFNGAVGTSV